MRRPLFGLVVALGISAVSSEARAQVPFGNINDPFFAYYSFYLPRQQAQALSPGPEATINAVTANRQQYAATNRNGMFDPNGVRAPGSARPTSATISPRAAASGRGAFRPTRPASAASMAAISTAWAPRATMVGRLTPITRI